jgi:hypothetical protein
MLCYRIVTVVQKVNQLIDQKTRFIDQLDRKNIQLNKAYGLYGTQKPCDTSSQTTVRKTT